MLSLSFQSSQSTAIGVTPPMDAMNKCPYMLFNTTYVYHISCSVKIINKISEMCECLYINLVISYNRHVQAERILIQPEHEHTDKTPCVFLNVMKLKVFLQAVVKGF